MNAINVIFPYKWNGVWVFDDERVGLEKEPFVAGADVLLDKATVDIPDAAYGLRLTFSEYEFPEYDECIEWRRSEASGNVYWSDKFEMEGWLCPALLKYFDEPPTNIYIKVDARYPCRTRAHPSSRCRGREII